MLKGEAGTNSFSNLSFQEELSTKELSNIEQKEQIAAREAGTNSFSKSFLDRILSLRKWLQIFLLSSFQLTCAALLLGTYSVSMSFQSLSEQLGRNSFQSFQLCRSNLDSLIRQLDLVTSLSLALVLGSRSCRTQLENKQVQQLTQKSFQLTSAVLLAATLVAFSLGAYQHKSFQLPMQQLCLGWTQGGDYPHRALPRARCTSLHRPALTLISLSFTIDAWLKTSSDRAWTRRSLTTRSWRTRSSPTACTTSTNRSTTRSLRRTLLSIVWFSFLISNIFLGNSFWKQEVAENDELSENVWEQELEEQLAAKPLQQDQLQQNQLKEKNQNKKHKDQLRANSVPDSELRQLHLQHLHEQEQPFTGTKHLPKEQCLTSCLLRQMISSFSKKELERLHLTRSSLEQDEHKKQLEQLLSEQLCA